MSRKEELLKIFNDIDKNKKLLVIKLIDDVVYIEEQMEELRKLPLIKIHPTNNELQKQTVAGKMYKDFLQQYNNCIKTLYSILHKSEDGEEESPLREYFRKLRE